MANSVNSDQTAPLGAPWSGSALFAQAYLSKKLGSLRYGYFQSKIYLRMADLNVKAIELEWIGIVTDDWPFIVIHWIYESNSAFDISVLEPCQGKKRLLVIIFNKWVYFCYILM